MGLRHRQKMGLRDFLEGNAYALHGIARRSDPFIATGYTLKSNLKRLTRFVFSCADSAELAAVRSVSENADAVKFVAFIDHAALRTSSIWLFKSEIAD